ncbi:Helix-turn-helix domain-containing protein [Clostridium cavendishii DSM 21758]|uniref:Helix-turn-helix domain-containing protein n=1 Tax=Clostridium cavendishii DSM 21758 TaxID=1121302 RepID=A0A1M6RZE4_9CLOT|nr:helix-turn-helix transcriptional regulator [Clostridium cavendishii]SHK37932.1 Helix-turn-helix domain-containing protein [Clostridium cavendishii DSM 21758]
MFNKDLILKSINNKGWSKYRLCKEANLAQSTLSDIINGKNSNPRMDTIQKIATALNMDVHEFFDESFSLKNGDIEKFDSTIDTNKLANEGKLIDSIQKTYGKQSVELLENFLKLNDLGKKEATKRVSELNCIPMYSNQNELSATLEDMFTTVAAHNDNLTNEEAEEMDRRILTEIKRLK